MVESWEYHGDIMGEMMTDEASGNSVHCRGSHGPWWLSIAQTLHCQRVWVMNHDYKWTIVDYFSFLLWMKAINKKLNAKFWHDQRYDGWCMIFVDFSRANYCIPRQTPPTLTQLNRVPKASTGFGLASVRLVDDFMCSLLSTVIWSLRLLITME